MISPGYQVPLATAVKKASGVTVQVVGMIVDPIQAEAIIANRQADCVALARAFLDNPRWVWHAAIRLAAEVAYAPQYRRARPDQWPGTVLAHRPAPVKRFLNSNRFGDLVSMAPTDQKPA